MSNKPNYNEKILIETLETDFKHKKINHTKSFNTMKATWNCLKKLDNKTQ